MFLQLSYALILLTSILSSSSDNLFESIEHVIFYITWAFDRHFKAAINIKDGYFSIYRGYNKQSRKDYKEYYYLY